MDEHKFKLAKRAMTLAFAFVLIVTIVWIVVTHNPTSLNVNIGISNITAEISCNFAGEINSAGE